MFIMYSIITKTRDFFFSANDEGISGAQTNGKGVK
jgi:hypothetical protein